MILGMLLETMKGASALLRYWWRLVYWVICAFVNSGCIRWEFR